MLSPPPEWSCPSKQSVERTGTIYEHVYLINNLTYIVHVFKEALAKILTKKLYVLEIGK
jgi:hypothetical protein